MNELILNKAKAIAKVLLKIAKALLEKITTTVSAATLQGISIALLTILIPLAIALFEMTEFRELDRKVLGKKVVNFKGLLCLWGCIFIPLIFWDPSKNSIYIQTLLFLFYLVGISLLVWNILKINPWLLDEEYRYKLRHSYLKDLEAKDLQYAKKIYRSLWKRKLPADQEIKFAQSFFGLIGKVLNKKDLTYNDIDAVSNFLHFFSETLGKRSLYFLLDETFLVSFLKQFGLVLDKERDITKEQFQKLSHEVGEQAIFLMKKQASIVSCKEQFQRIFGCLVQYVIENNANLVPIFVGRVFYNNRYVKNENFYRELSKIFWEILFKAIESNPDKSKILKNLPKINSNRLVKKDLFTQFALSNFLEYFHQSFFNKDPTFQTAWQSILSELFEADPMCLARFLIFALADRDKPHLILTLAESPNQTKEECLALIKVLIREALKKEKKRH